MIVDDMTASAVEITEFNLTCCEEMVETKAASQITKAADLDLILSVIEQKKCM